MWAQREQAVVTLPDGAARVSKVLPNPIFIGYDSSRMGRTQGTDESERRVQRLMDELFAGFPHPDETVATLATQTGLRHETVRNLLRNPAGRLRAGPGFLTVALIARARNVSLENLSSAAYPTSPIGRGDE